MTEEPLLERQEVEAHLEARRDVADGGKRQLILGIVSLALGIPISAVAGGVAELPGLAVAWLGIAAVNMAHAAAVSGSRRTPRGR